VQLRAPVPDGWRVEGVEIDGAGAKLSNGDVIDLSGLAKPMVVRFKVRRD